MASGGARARSGPAPDQNALHQKGEWTELPRERFGAVPAWPMSTQTDREAEVWAAMWRKPQAILWERDLMVEQVALYVRGLVRGEDLDAPTTLLTWLRQMGSELMLTPDGLARQRLRIRPAESKMNDDAPVRTSSVKGRLRVVDGGAG